MDDSPCDSVVEREMHTTNYHGATTGDGPVRIRHAGCCGEERLLYEWRNGGPQIFTLRKSPTTGTLVLTTETVAGALAEGPWGIEL